jgi:hypothetical protein
MVVYPTDRVLGSGRAGRRTLETSFAPSSTAVVGGVRNLGGNIEVTGQPVVWAPTISARRGAVRRGAGRHRGGNILVASEVASLESPAPREEPSVLAFWFDPSGRASIAEGLAVAWIAVLVYEGSIDRSTQAAMECLHSDANRGGRSFPPTASLRLQARDEALRARLCSVATSSRVLGRYIRSCGSPTGVTRFVGHTLDTRRKGMRGRQCWFTPFAVSPRTQNREDRKRSRREYPTNMGARFAGRAL